MFVYRTCRVVCNIHKEDKKMNGCVRQGERNESLWKENK